jgi:hypothetical protein
LSRAGCVRARRSVVRLQETSAAICLSMREPRALRLLASCVVVTSYPRGRLSHRPRMALVSVTRSDSPSPAFVAPHVQARASGTETGTPWTITVRGGASWLRCPGGSPPRAAGLLGPPGECEVL